MKHVFKHLKKVFLMVAFCATVMGYAKDPSYFIVNNIREGATVLTLKSVKEGDALFIIAGNGTILHKEYIKVNGIYQKGFDLKSLPDGSYSFRLNKDVEVRTFPFKVENNNVVFEKNKEKVIFKPYLWTRENKVFISKLALNEEPLNINIYFENENSTKLIFSEEIKGSKTLERVYQLDNNLKGNYRVVLISEGYTYVENFKI